MNEPREPNSSKWKIAIWRMHAYLYRKFPLLVPRPNIKELLASVRRSDAEANRRSEPPVDEEILIRSLWAVEFYSPSHISNLIEKFSTLGWTAEKNSRRNRDPASWIQERRTAPNATGWMNLGVIRRGTDTEPFGYGHHADLPEGIEYAIAAMHSLTSSVSCIVVGFIMDDLASKRIDKALRQERTTELKALKRGGHQIMGPVFQKQRDVAAIRTELRHRTSGWFRANLPGLFASDGVVGSHPTCEVLTLRVTNPFPEEEQDSSATWLTSLELHRSGEVWSSRTWDGLKLVWPLRGEMRSQPHAILVTREDSHLCEKAEEDDGGNRELLVHELERIPSTLVSRWGIVGMLNYYERYLNYCRDMMIPSARPKATPVKVIDDVCSRVANGIDISAMAVELREFAGTSGTFRLDLEEFDSFRSLSGTRNTRSLSSELMRLTHNQSMRIESADQASRTILNQYASLLATRENLRLQRQVSRLTGAIAFLTVIIVVFTMVTTFPSVKEWVVSWQELLIGSFMESL